MDPFGAGETGDLVTVGVSAGALGAAPIGRPLE